MIPPSAFSKWIFIHLHLITALTPNPIAIHALSAVSMRSLSSIARARIPHLPARIRAFSPVSAFGNFHEHRRHAGAFMNSKNNEYAGSGSGGRRPSSTSSSRMAEIFKKGDSVRLIDNAGTDVTGTILDRRGGGWYSIQVSQKDAPGTSDPGTILKRRSGDFFALEDSSDSPLPNKTEPAKIAQRPVSRAPVVLEESGSPAQILPTAVSPPPFMADLDALMREGSDDAFGAENGVSNAKDKQFLRQCLHHASYDKWVVFTDLHVAPSSIETTIEILNEVHKAAVERNAGVLFLGDWWHHRGTIRVDCLNSILSALSGWDVPLVMIPGNHDQVTFGGLDHSLTPLQNAFSVNENQFPGPLIFSHPTKFLNALFVPHIRSNAVMESVLSSDMALSSAALFVHADITGASMNDRIVSQGGVSPKSFPPNRPIYSGHFHLPHVVEAPSSNVSIRYVGSPYETSLAEAGQTKALLVLDASEDWACKESITLRIGRRHFRFNSYEEFLRLPLAAEERGGGGIDAVDCPRRGDRVVVSVSREDLEDAQRALTCSPGVSTPFDAKVAELRKYGAKVEVREVKSVPSEPMTVVGAGAPETEDISPRATFISFLEAEIGRGSMTDERAQELEMAGLKLLDEISSSNDNDDSGLSESNVGSELVLESLSVRGFGSFKDLVHYPLNERGLVLLRGSNKDGGSDSNGCGKSTLAMSTLWALTGSLDPRPTQDAKVSDVVHDSCKSATVSVRGTVNSLPFVVTRIKTSTKTSLTFLLDDKDLTRQSVKETQNLLEEVLGVSSQILARTIFHGQHSTNGLLEATDTQLKDELSNIVPLEVWKEATVSARSKKTKLSKRATELDGMLLMREKDVSAITEKMASAERVLSSRQDAFSEMKNQERKEMDGFAESDDSNQNVTLASCRKLLDEAIGHVEKVDAQRQSAAAERDTNLRSTREDYNSAILSTVDIRNELSSSERQYDRSNSALEFAREDRIKLSLKWEKATDPVDERTTPDICPTCERPLDLEGDGHSHARDVLKQVMEGELSIAEKTELDALASVTAKREDVEVGRRKFEGVEERNTKLEKNLNSLEAEWFDRIGRLDDVLTEARSLQSQRSAEMSEMATRIQRNSEKKSRESALELRLQRFASECDSARATLTDIQAELQKDEENIRELKIERDLARKNSAIMSGLADSFGPRGAQTFVLRNAVYALQISAQTFLDHLSDGSQSLNLELDSGDRIFRNSAVRGAEGEWVPRPLSSLSGGQWRRCSLALSLGFSDLASRRGRLRPSLMVLDEPLTHLDATGRAHVGKLLRLMLARQSDDDVLEDKVGLGGRSVSTILIILQDLAAEELEESFDEIDEVVKLGGNSFVRIDAGDYSDS